ncbi:DUF1242 domain-containing protein, partial [Cephalotus follicularis]
YIFLFLFIIFYSSFEILASILFKQRKRSSPFSSWDLKLRYLVVFLCFFFVRYYGNSRLLRFERRKAINIRELRHVVLLGICTCTYLKMQFPAILEQRTGFRGFFWKAARIGERLSPWMAVGCFTMGVSIIFF